MELVHLILGKKEKKKYSSPQLYPDAVKDILWESSSIVGIFTKEMETQTSDCFG